MRGSEPSDQKREEEGGNLVRRKLPLDREILYIVLSDSRIKVDSLEAPNNVLKRQISRMDDDRTKRQR
jgi:hypothetical protein